jgi:hypothetical protein
MPTYFILVYFIQERVFLATPTDFWSTVFFEWLGSLGRNENRGLP